jgi:hypothetical protein
MVAGGRIPGYVSYAGKMSAEEYIEKVARGELKDQALNAHLKAGYKVRSVHMGYLRDAQSLNYARVRGAVLWLRSSSVQSLRL